MLGNDFLIGKRNILKRVGDNTVVTTSLKKKKKVTIEKWKTKSYMHKKRGQGNSRKIKGRK